LRQIRKTPLSGRFAYLAERGGFEPPRRYKRLPDFESGTFNHSATSPVVPGRGAGGAMIRGRGRRDKERALHCAAPPCPGGPEMSEITVPVSFGELLDKISILQIKS